PGDSYELVRNAAYFAGGPKGTPKIGKLSIRSINDDATVIAELLGGGLDWAWNLPADQMERLDNVPELSTTRAEAMRVAYVGLDVSGRSGVTQFKDVRVRQAVAQAINIPAMVKNLVQGNSRVIFAPCFPKQFGCDESVARHWQYD